LTKNAFVPLETVILSTLKNRYRVSESFYSLIYDIRFISGLKTNELKVSLKYKYMMVEVCYYDVLQNLNLPNQMKPGQSVINSSTLCPGERILF
jgi:hypothetical protein